MLFIKFSILFSYFLKEGNPYGCSLGVVDLTINLDFSFSPEIMFSCISSNDRSGDIASSGGAKIIPFTFFFPFTFGMKNFEFNFFY